MTPRRLLAAAQLACIASVAAAGGQTSLDGTRLGAWPQRAPMGAPRGDPFTVPTGARAARPAAARPAPRAATAAPPNPYRLAGSVVTEGVRQVLLVKGDEIIPITEGDMLEGDYRVASIGTDEVTLVYLPLGARESLPLVANASAPRTARLRWDGPERVQAGQPFKVILRVTSDEPLRAAAVELTFDPAVVEPIAVQPGKAFEAAGFAHRIDPGGSIVIGASGRKGEPVRPPRDSELLIFVFKATRPASATEITFASLALEGAVGKPLPAAPPAAFRAAIGP